MNALFINGSPRKEFNTAQLIDKAREGAESLGFDTERVDLFDYEFNDCRECFACKIKGSRTNGVCAIRDSIHPVLEKIHEADVIVVGSPVYFNSVTGCVRNLLDRAMFPLDTYMIDFEKKIRLQVPHKKAYTGLIYAMNCPEDFLEQANYETLLGNLGFEMGRIFGYNEVQFSCATMQFSDYSKYDINMFDGEERRKHREKQFPEDLQKAYDLGRRLAEMALNHASEVKNES